jgi:hypothetical protein
VGGSGLQWGSTLPDYAVFHNYTSSKIRAELERMTERQLVETKPGRFGPLFKIR